MTPPAARRRTPASPAAEPDTRTVEPLLLDAEVDESKAQPDLEPVHLRREGTRSVLAVVLVLSLAVLSLVYLVLAFFADKASWTQASGAFDKVFTALVGLAGTALGFYFGSGGATGGGAGPPARRR